MNNRKVAIGRLMSHQHEQLNRTMCSLFHMITLPLIMNFVKLWYSIDQLTPRSYFLRCNFRNIVEWHQFERFAHRAFNICIVDLECCAKILAEIFIWMYEICYCHSPFGWVTWFDVWWYFEAALCYGYGCHYFRCERFIHIIWSWSAPWKCFK